MEQKSSYQILDDWNTDGSNDLNTGYKKQRRFPVEMLANTVKWNFSLTDKIYCIKTRRKTTTLKSVKTHENCTDCNLRDTSQPVNRNLEKKIGNAV